MTPKFVKSAPPPYSELPEGGAVAAPPLFSGNGKASLAPVHAQHGNDLVDSGYESDNDCARSNSGLDDEETLGAFSTAELDRKDLPSPTAEDKEIVQAMVAWIPSQSPVSSRTPLQAPVAIPQIAKNTPRMMMPYMRAYSPDLQSHGVEMNEFLAFIDNLNLAQAMYPPLLALYLAAVGVGFVPSAWAIGTSFGIQAIARFVNATIVRVRTKRYMERVNREYFAPRGLKATLCKDDELQTITSFPSDKPRVCSRRECGHDPSLRTRRLRALDGYIAPLTMDVSAPEAQTKVFKKISAKQVGWSISRRQKKEAKAHGKAQRREAKRLAKRGAENQKSSPASLSALPSYEPQDHDHALKLQKGMAQREPAEALLQTSGAEKNAAEVELQKEIDLDLVVDKLRVDDGAQRQQQQQQQLCLTRRERKREGKRESKDANAVSSLGWIVIQSL